MRRTRTILGPSALFFILACGGGSSDSTPRSTAPSAATVSQSTTLATGFVQGLASYIPDAATPTARPAAPLRAFQLLLPEKARAAAGIAGLPAELPCAPSVSDTTDANGYQVHTEDYTGCTDGMGGRLITRWKDTSTTQDLQITFDHFIYSHNDGQSTTTYAQNGSFALSGAQGPNGDWSLRYATGANGIATSITSGNRTLYNVVFGVDMTSTWHIISPSPLLATFTTSGHSSWSGTFMDPQSNQTYSDTYAFNIAQGTPLVWNVDQAQASPCNYPVSGTIDIARGQEKLSITFSGSCGSIVINPGNIKQQLPLF